MPVIEVDHVTKCYPGRRGRRALTGRGGIGGFFSGARANSVPVLEDVSLHVQPGETLGIIGRNGSGKSTLLKLMAGVSLPTAGAVRVNGRVASLLELGAGFHPMLTGRENIYLNAGLLGMRRVSVDRVLDRIIDFAGIGDALDKAVDTYSSGMYVRLGFAVAVHSNPDVFLVDEVLSVGDEAFQRKCRQKIGELKEQGKSIVFVSHDLGTVHALCDRVVLLQQGRLLDRGSAQATIDFYLRQVGGDAGIHLLRAGNNEAIFSHGRVSLFRESAELTAPQGLSVVLNSLGSQHTSLEAEWECLERSETHLRARGRLSRLPLALFWELTLRPEGLRLQWALEVDRETVLDHLGMLLPFVQEYDTWHYGDLAGSFPPIPPDQVQAAMLVPPTPGVSEVALLSAADRHPPVEISLSEAHPFLMLQLQNSEYMAGTRYLYGGLNLPQAELPLQPGTHPIATVQIATPQTAQEVEQRFQQKRNARRLHSGTLTAVLDPGQIVIESKHHPITAELHWHTQLRAGDLWLMSHALHWSPATRSADVLAASGRSVRLPGTQHWRLSPVAGGFALEVSVDLDAPFAIQEYNVSIALHSEYLRWQTEHEQGEFPPVLAGAQAWRHLNQNYEESAYIRAEAEDLPRVRLEAAPELPFRMSAVNPAYGQPARILQALRTPGPSGVFRLEPGRHLLFRGRCLVDTE